MCGNGLRCLIDFLRSLGAIEKRASIETKHQIYPCKWSPNGVRVSMGLPKIIGNEGDNFFVEVGVPHLVVFVDHLKRFDEEAKKRFLFGESILIMLNSLLAVRSQCARLNVE